MTAHLEERFLWKGKVNQSELIREACRKLGASVTVPEATDWIKRNYGVELSAGIMANFTHIKNLAVKAATVAAGETNGHAPAATVAARFVRKGSATVAAPPAASAPVMDCVALVLAVRECIRVCGGKDGLKRLVDLL